MAVCGSPPAPVRGSGRGSAGPGPARPAGLRPRPRRDRRDPESPRASPPCRAQYRAGTYISAGPAADVIGVAHPLGQVDGRVLDGAVGHLLQQVADAVEAGALLVDGVDHPPRRLGDVGAGQHVLLGPGVALPAPARFDVHRAELPLLERILDPHLEAMGLLGVGDREPVLHQDDAGAHQHLLELGHRAEELLHVGLGAEAHHPLDAGPVVPGAVEQHHLAAGRQVADVALEVPLAALALVRSGEGGDAADPRVEALGDALDDAALAGGVPPLEQHYDLELVGLDPVLEPHQLVLEPQQLAEVEAPVELRPGALARRHEAGEALLLHLEFQLLVVGLGDLAPERRDEGRLRRAVQLAHGGVSRSRSFDRKPYPPSRDTIEKPAAGTATAGSLTMGKGKWWGK